MSGNGTHLYACVWMSQQGATDCWFTSFNNYHSWGGRNSRNEERLWSTQSPSSHENTWISWISWLSLSCVKPHLTLRGPLVVLSYVCLLTMTWVGHRGAMLRSTWTGHQTSGGWFVHLFRHLAFAKVIELCRVYLKLTVYKLACFSWLTG